MKFDVQTKDLEGKLQELRGLQAVLRELDANDSGVTEEPAERTVLPYSGRRPISPQPWNSK